jgi:hypothetical protein
VGLAGGELAGADRAGDADVFAPVDRQNIRAGGVVAVGANHVHTASAQAEGFHEAGVVERGAGVGVEDHQLLADDVHVGFDAAQLGRVLGQNTDADVDAGVEEQRAELGHAHPDRGRTGEAGDHFGVVAQLVPERQADHQAVGHAAGVGREGFNLLVEFGDGVVTRQGDVGRSRQRGQRGEHLGLVRGDGGGDEGLGFRLFQAKGIALAGFVAFVVVDGDFECLGKTVVGGVAGGEFEAFGGAADGAGGVDHLEGVFVVEVFILAGGGGDHHLGGEEVGQRRGDVLGQAAGVVGQGDVVLGGAHEKEDDRGQRTDGRGRISDRENE